MAARKAAKTSIRIKVSSDWKARLKAHALVSGESMAGYLRSSAERRMLEAESPPEAPQVPPGRLARVLMALRLRPRPVKALLPPPIGPRGSG